MASLPLPADTPPIQRIEVTALDPEKANVCIAYVPADPPPTVPDMMRLKRFLLETLAPCGVREVIVIESRVQLKFAEGEQPTDGIH